MIYKVYLSHYNQIFFQTTNTRLETPVRSYQKTTKSKIEYSDEILQVAEEKIKYRRAKNSEQGKLNL